MEQNLTRYDFQKELLIMAESCVGNKKDTAKRKAKLLFDKYEDLFYYSTTSKNNIDIRLSNNENIIRCLKKGIIEYEGGLLRISEIEFIREDKENIIVNMKSGNSLNLSKDFKYIHDIFK